MLQGLFTYKPTIIISEASTLAQPGVCIHPVHLPAIALFDRRISRARYRRFELAVRRAIPT